MYLNSKVKEECCGCTACQQVCKAGAISMQSDSEGFLYPVKKIDLCNNCGLCEKVCPFHNPLSIKSEPQVFAAYSKDAEERTKSSSGALFYILAKEVIKRGGVVYGAKFQEDFSLIHKAAYVTQELDALRGSKYVQSDLNNVFQEVYSHLRNNVLVYFVGTPCQVAGLKSFLRKDYLNLLTSDLVCHGTPSQLLFKKHIDYIKQKYNILRLSSYHFRNNNGWGVCEIFNFTNHKGRTKTKILPTYELSPYLYSFINAYTYRYSCYNCPFAAVPRQGDITLADFWGVEHFVKGIDTSKGCSLVLLNTSKGSNFWKNIADEVVAFPSDLASASVYNANLIRKTVMPIQRTGMYERIEKLGYKRVAQTEFKSSKWKGILLRFYLKQLLGRKLTRIVLCLKKYLYAKSNACLRYPSRSYKNGSFGERISEASTRV